MKCSSCGCALNVHQEVRGSTCDRHECRALAAKHHIAKQRANEKEAETAITTAVFNEMLAQRPQLQAGSASLMVLFGLDSPMEEIGEARKENFRAHIRQLVSTSVASKDTLPEAAGTDSELPDKSAAPTDTIASACATCRGYCCRNGGDSAYINAATIARVLAHQPELQHEDLVGAYVDALPSQSVSGSCIFHGNSGCTLPRDLRSQTCNDYFCGPMHQWFARQQDSSPGPLAVVVVHETRVLRSTLIEND